MRTDARGSLRKRDTASGLESASGRRNLRATRSSSSTCRAATTTPMPPCPSSRSTRYFPARTSPSRTGAFMARAQDYAGGRRAASVPPPCGSEGRLQTRRTVPRAGGSLRPRAPPPHDRRQRHGGHERRSVERRLDPVIDAEEREAADGGGQ